MIAPGDTLGRYRIEAVLGRGAMGEVYRAVDPAIGRAVAIKTVRLDSALLDAADDDLFERFRREARSAGRLKHHNIVAVYDYGEEDGLYWLVMELVEGTTLAERIAAAGPLVPEEACSVAIQACAALGVAHARGVVHRDIKPANLMIEAETGLVKVLDFGVARLDASELTRTGVVFGTPAYMAPEQILGRHVDHRSDLFSLAAVFYETLTGQKAFPGDHLATITYRIVNDDPEGFAEIPARLGDGYAWVIGRALAKDPSARFQSAGELSEAIQTHGLGSVAAPESPYRGTSTPGPGGGGGTPPGGWGPSGTPPGGWNQPGTPSGGWSGPGTPPGGWSHPGTPPGGWSGPGTPAGGWDHPGTPPGGWGPAPGGAPAPSGRSRRRSILLGGALALVIAAGAGAWAMFGDSSRSARPTGAVAARADSAAGLAALDSAAAAGESRLVLALDPASAEVLVDDSLAAASGDTLTLTAGLHAIAVRAEGRAPVDTTLTLDAGATASLSISLVEEPAEDAGPTTGRVDLVANVPGRVFLGRRDLGPAPRRGLELGAGRHTVRFVPDGAAQLAVERTVQVPAGGSAAVSFDVTDGLLSVGVREPKWASVHVDGARLGDTPLIARRVRAGPHLVRVERDGYRPAERSMTVEPGKHARWVDIRLESTGGQR